MRRVTQQVKRTVQYGMFPLRVVAQPRRFQAYGVGTGRSGTHSITGVFSGQYRAAHYPEIEFVINTIIAAANGSISEKEKRNFVRKRDKRLWLEFETSLLNYYFLDILVQEFPLAKFILTIRDCYSWLDSFVNHKLAIGDSAKDYWLKMRNFRFRPNEFQYAKEEHILVKHGLYPIDSYLSVWGTHNRKVLETVPKERLLVVRTHEIAQDIPKIAEFLGIPVESLDRSQTHLYKAQRKFGILAKIDRDFLEEKIDVHCRDLLDQYFPEVRSLNDVFKE